MLQRSGAGFGMMAATALLGQESLGAPTARSPLAPKETHFSAKAKRIIFLFMNGGPSHVDTFDPKPELARRHGEEYFDRIAGEVENPTEAGALKSPSPVY